MSEKGFFPFQYTINKKFYLTYNELNYNALFSIFELQKFKKL